MTEINTAVTQTANAPGAVAQTSAAPGAAGRTPVAQSMFPQIILPAGEQMEGHAGQALSGQKLLGQTLGHAGSQVEGQNGFPTFDSRAAMTSSHVIANASATDGSDFGGQTGNQRGSLDFMNFFRFVRLPFSSDIAVENLCSTPQFVDVKNRLHHAALYNQFAVLLGPVGAGKSTALRAFVSELDSSLYTVLYISQSNLSPRWLYTIPLNDMGIKACFYANDAKKQFHEALINLTNAQRKKVVLIVDEAHLLTHETLQEIRFLLNCRFDSGNPLCLILAGQEEEMMTMLAQTRNEAISQRIDTRCKLRCMSLDQVGAYISAHLIYAGGSDRIFSTDAVEEVYKCTKGCPRVINKLCSMTLLYASSRSMPVVGAALVRDVNAREM